MSPAAFPVTSLPDPTFRLVPSRFPPVSAFETVASAADLDAVMELEGWTNDRLVKQRLARLAPDDRVYGVPNASIVMAAFLHAAPGGLRFTTPELGAWYAGLAMNTAVAEVAHHLRREAVNTNAPEMRVECRCYSARLDGRYVDIRADDGPGLHDPAHYGAAQRFGESVRARTDVNGILYRSVRHAGGGNAVCYRPRAIHEVTQGAHLEITVRPTGRIAVRRL
ncbi:RES family NAD+ phosphorylase [Nitrospirillum iridis]|uniref:RES domain-containing protein n=1 Tax=Nitrospirillum iridis TaxID=765888 RepID=A0A7X0B5C2_9PROT|nr:RES family NAD+ phosphorylase [Nitrospirillum iridis]MBB6255281.1 hypothetical protein [Nitrospirillum iridis]